METEIVTNTNGTLTSIGHSLVSVSSATKAFVIAHPIGMAAAGGAVLGIILYRSVTKRSKKKDAVVQQATVATA
jgi:hypothetical protein